MRTLFIVLLSAFFAAGCSHKGLVTTYSVASTQQMVVPSVKQSISTETCAGFGSATADAMGGKFWEQVYVEAFTNTLNKAKRDGIVADALASPSIVRKSTFSLDFCSVASGKPVGLKLVK